MKRLAFILLLVSLSFASLIWQFPSGGAVAAKPLLLQGMLVVASDDGNIYAVQPASGSKVWQVQVGMKPNEVIAFDNAAVVSTTGGSVIKLDRNGKTLWYVNLKSQYNVSYVYGASANAKEVFVSANNGIYTIENNGTVHYLGSLPNVLVTAPAAGPDYVIYGINDTLYKLSDTRGIVWSASIGGGSFLPPAAIDNNGAVYAGALDGIMHAYTSNGGQMWQVRTHNWVMGTPLVTGGTAYFGSNDGRVYAVDAGTGDIRWEAQTQLAVQTEPEPGTMGGRNVVFVGSTDRSIYAIDTSDGEIVWKGSASGGIGNPLFYQGMVIFGSQDKRVYAYSTERACSITNPLEANVLGLKEVAVRGKYVSSAGGASVYVNVDSQGWQQANVTNDDWVYYIDPKASFNPGLNTIQCKVVDNGGEESGGVYTTVTVNHDPTIPLSTLVVTASPNAIETVPVTIYVNDGDDGSPLDRFTLNVDGKTLSGDKNITFKLAAGTHTVTVKKAGFNDATVGISVSSAGMNPLYIVVGVVLILIIIWRAWPSFSRARTRRG